MKDLLINNFCRVSAIPRQSGNEEKIANFFVDVANKNNLYYYKDQNNNVLIKKKGCINCEPIALQAHLDMVCIKEISSKHNFQKDGIEVIINEDEVTARDTSLGADQGVGLSMILSILEDNSLKHPNLEIILTSEEETTFNGAVSFDYSKLNGKRLINLDHCKDNSIVIGCDADICNKYIFEGKLITSSIPSYKIKISNVKGGNSGIEIDERSNKSAIILMAKILQKLQIVDDVLIYEISGGKSEGDIATSCECIIKTKIKDIENKVKENFQEDNIQIQVNKTLMDLSFSVEDSKKIINEIINLKQGLVETKDNIITSGNIGIIETKKNKVIITGILRSIEEKELQKQNRENYSISKKNDFVVEEIYQDSAWIPNINSKLKEDYKNIYYKVNGDYPDFEITHGGLECSCISKRMKGLDIISIGSIIEDFHTVNEKMYISSCEKTITTLLAYLECENN